MIFIDIHNFCCSELVDYIDVTFNPVIAENFLSHSPDVKSNVQPICNKETTRFVSVFLKFF